MNAGDIESLQGFDINNIYDAYAAWTDSVAKYPPAAEPFYLALGIADEIGELDAARGPEEILKESGDVLWYCARYCTKVIGIPFSGAVSIIERLPNAVTTVSRAVGILCGVEKKRIRDGADWDDNKKYDKIEESTSAMLDVLRFVKNSLAAEGFTIGKAMSTNIKKLEARADAGTIQGDGDNR